MKSTSKVHHLCRKQDTGITTRIASMASGFSVVTLTLFSLIHAASGETQATEAPTNTTLPVEAVQQESPGNAPASEATVPESLPPVSWNCVNQTIDQVKCESLKDSLKNAGRVEDFYKPGYHPASAIAQPLDDIRIILSNRKFEKIYLDLASLPSNQARIVLNDAFSYHLEYLKNFMAEYKGSEVSDDKLKQLNMISSPQGSQAPLIGEIHALRMIALLAGLLECEGMKPSLESAFAHPAAGFELDLTEYHPGLQNMLTHMPVFPEPFQFQIRWLMDKENNGGFETKRLPISPFKAQGTASEAPHNSRAKIQSDKTFELEFLDIPSDAEL